MRFEKIRMAGETKAIWPPRPELIQGRWVHDIGLVVKFEGKPPICDTEKWATIRADWEEKMGKINQGDAKAKAIRIKQLDKIIVDYLLSHEDYKNNFIVPEKSRRQRLIEQNQMVCPHCTDEDNPYVAGNANDFAEHIAEEHSGQKKEVEVIEEASV